MKKYYTSNSTYVYIDPETKEQILKNYYITQPETQDEFLNQNQQLIPDDKNSFAPIRNKHTYPIFLKEKPY